MPRIPGTNDQQSLFLRAFKTNPGGPPPELWPTPATLRRWLRRPAFKRALKALQSAMRLQADFNIHSAAAVATQTLHQAAADPKQSKNLSPLFDFLRLSHLRHRFTRAKKPAQARDNPRSAKSRDEKIPYETIRNNLHRLSIYHRCSGRELHDFATKEGYIKPLKDVPFFPRPRPQDTFYYELLHDSRRLLWYLHLLDETGDRRFAHVLSACKPFVPSESPEEKLPRFQPEPQPAAPHPT